MNDPKNLGGAFLENIQGEVSAENAPLLQFITKYAGAIAGAVILLMLVLAGMAFWNWRENTKMEETKAELSRITLNMKGAEKNQALASLAEKAPDAMKLYVYMTLGKSAAESGDFKLASETYSKVSQMDKDGALGLAASIAAAESLLYLGENDRGLAILQDLQGKLPQTGQSAQLKQMLAEAAIQAGKIDLAINVYKNLADQAQGADGSYYRKRAAALEKSQQQQDSK